MVRAAIADRMGSKHHDRFKEPEVLLYSEQGPFYANAQGNVIIAQLRASELPSYSPHQFAINCLIDGIGGGFKPEHQRTKACTQNGGLSRCSAPFSQGGGIAKQLDRGLTPSL